MPRPIQQALISVSDKTNIVPFAKNLNKLGVKLLSTGGTYKLLQENGIDVTEVSEHTAFPEMMQGRIKTLHPKIHGGILARRGTDEAVMEEHGIAAIDLVVVNLYPFEQTIAKPDCDLADAIENIDIGGPTMVRAAAKNHADVTIVVDVNDYDAIIADMQANQGEVNAEKRFALAVKAFSHTAHYDGAISNYLSALGDQALTEEKQIQRFPATYNVQLQKAQDMRYGENPHQQGAFYVQDDAPSDSVSRAQQRQGKALSFNNVADTDTALECVKAFAEPACVIVKHANPCGVATGSGTLEAYQRAFQTDPTSAFGGIIAFNRDIDADTAQQIVDQQFVEVVIAPCFSDAAKQAFSAKANVRVLECGPIEADKSTHFDYKRVNGGLLIQDQDQAVITPDDLKVVTRRAPSSEEIQDLLFTWTVAKFVKSNAIVYAKNQQTMGIGAGQMSRVYSAKIANIKAADEKLQVAGSVMASDAFFPFRDGIDAAAEAGVNAIIQPGGSIRDEEVIAAADEADIAMVFTGVRHFRH